MTSEEIIGVVNERVKHRNDDVILKVINYLQVTSNSPINNLSVKYNVKLKEYVRAKMNLHNWKKPFFYENNFFIDNLNATILWKKAFNLITQTWPLEYVSNKQRIIDYHPMANYYRKMYSKTVSFSSLVPHSQELIITALVIADEMETQGLESGNNLKSGLYDLFFETPLSSNELEQKIKMKKEQIAILKSEKDKLKNELLMISENSHYIDIVDKLFHD